MTETAALPITGGHTGDPAGRSAHYTAGQVEPLRATIQTASFPSPQRLGILVKEYAEIAMSTMRFTAQTAAPGYALWQQVEAIAEVESLWIDPEPDCLRVWVISNGLPRSSERRIYRLYREWLLANPALLAELHLLDRAQLQCDQGWTFGDTAIEYKRRRHA